MSFNIALSGINASQKDLDVTANNIANVNTIGFKESRAEFADVYATSIFSNARTAVGNGAKTVDVAQQFHQGSLNFTQNALDMAISGEGFFVTASDLNTQTREFTRAGAFKLNADNFIVNSQGQYLQGYTVNSSGTPSAVSMAATSAIQISAEVGNPTMTSQVDMSFNLPSGGSTHNLGDFDPTDSNTYTSATSVTVYDSQGGSHVKETYFIKDETAANTWHMVTYMDGKPVDVEGGKPQESSASNSNTTIPLSATLVFDNSGALESTVPAVIRSIPLGTESAGALLDIGNFNPNDSTTYSSRTSEVVYDPNGDSYLKETYYVRDQANPNEWLAFFAVDGQLTNVNGGETVTPNLGNPTAIPLAARISYDANGDYVSSNPDPINSVNLPYTDSNGFPQNWNFTHSAPSTVPKPNVPGGVWDPVTGSVDPTQAITFNLNGPTQYNSAFEVSSLSQDGSTVGKLTGIDIGPDGLVVASYSNGQTDNIAKVSIAKFANNQGLSQIGDTAWQQTQLSGEAIAGEANSGTFGKINSASLEQANVNLTEQLVNLISAQRNFQANSRALEVNSTLQQTIIQIR